MKKEQTKSTASQEPIMKAETPSIDSLSNKRKAMGRSLVESRQGQCKYFIEETLCKKDALEEKPYCEEHYRLTHIVGSALRPNNSRNPYLRFIPLRGIGLLTK